MQEYLLESPWIIGLLGSFLSGVLVYAWLESGRGAFWKWSLGIALATLLSLIVNIGIQTDREILSQFMTKIAADLEANRFQDVTACVHPDASESLRSLKTQLETVQFESVRIKKIHGIDLGRMKNPRTAAIRMNVFVRASRDGNSGSVPRWVKIHLEQEKGKWMVVDYEHRDPQYEMLNRDAQDRMDSNYRR
ncbi:MAG: hypothetical protein ACK6AT_00855 [Planctomycetota bacterium]|jgi:hypothetical protein|nr:hypothetical protein [Planctomycetaceae bacterium]